MENNNNPWKSALLLAGASNPSSMVMTSANKIEVGGDKCPRCGSKMEDVKLSASSDRHVMYCPRDRVVVPLPVTE